MHFDPNKMITIKIDGIPVTVPSGTKIIDGMSMIDLSDLEIENIDQIENIEFNLRIVDANTWEDIVTTDVLTLDFE